MGPFIKDKNTTTKMMNHILIALTPIIIFTILKNGVVPYKKGYTDLTGLFYPLIFIIISTLSTLTFETIIKLIKTKNIKETLKNTYSIFPGLFLGLILPINTPIWVLILGALITTITKMIFGGYGKNKLNPALVGKLFIIVLFTSTIMNKGGYLNPYEINNNTPLINSTINGLGTYETRVLPYGRLLNIFIGNIPGTLGETSAFLSLLALIYLTYMKSIKWKIPVTYILTVFAITYVIGGTSNLGIWYPLLQIFTGGLIFNAVFLAPDTLTSPVTPIGQILYGIFLGILTVIIRYLIPIPNLEFISIIIMNALVILLDKIGSLARFNFKIAIIPFIISWILIIGLSIGISIKYENKETNTQQIIEEKINNQETINNEPKIIEENPTENKTEEIIINENEQINN